MADLFTTTQEERRDRLESILNAPVKLRYGRSGTQPVVARSPTKLELKREPRLKGGRVLILHKSFEDADTEVWEDLASWLRNGRRSRAACQRLDAWLDRLRVDPKPPKTVARPVGDMHRLDEIAQRVIADHLSEELKDRRTPNITWTPKKRSTARRGLRLGSYDASRDLVRIHSVLDQAAVPEWVVAFVVYHELLHAVIPSKRSGRRLIHHSAEFRKREAAHPDFLRVTRWENKHISRLIRAARTGKGIRRTLS